MSAGLEKTDMNKNVLITGANGDIGRQLALTFSENGWTPIVSGIQEHAIDGNPDYIKLDVAKEEDWENAFALIEQKYGRLQALVNNAGIVGTQLQDGLDIENTGLEAWQQIHEVNLTGTFLGCKYAVRHMKNNGSGSIVNMGSRSGIYPRAERIAYGTSKAAVHQLTKIVAIHCGEKGYNIRCNAIAGATIKTKLWEPVISRSNLPEKLVYEKLSKDIPLGRFGECEEITEAVLFLASDRSSYINGITLVIDGGFLAAKGYETQL